MMSRMTLLIASVLLAGCAAQPTPEIKYYLLSSTDIETRVTSSERNRQVLGIAPVTVADYINTEGLALLSNQNQLRIARHHRWAEKPEHAIARTLQTDLSGLLERIRVDNALESNSRHWNVRLRLHIDQLHGTEAGEAIVSGFWRLDQPESDEVLASQRFLLRKPLAQPGYGEMVRTIRELLRGLSDQIATELRSSERNAD